LPQPLALARDWIVHPAPKRLLDLPYLGRSAIEALPDPDRQFDAKRSSKQEAVIAMLQRPEGATVDEVAASISGRDGRSSAVIWCRKPAIADLDIYPIRILRARMQMAWMIKVVE
jgi:hypothetical protein